MIALPEFPPTGSRWAVDQGAGTLLALVSDDYDAPANNPPLAGAAGTEPFTFRVAQTGGGHLVLKSWRPAQGDHSFRARFEITVEVGS